MIKMLWKKSMEQPIYDPKFSMAGKTGLVRQKGKYISSFAGIAPLSSKRLMYSSYS